MVCSRLLVKETLRDGPCLELVWLGYLLWWTFLAFFASSDDVLVFVHIEIIVDEDLRSFLFELLYGFVLLKFLRSTDAASEWESILLEIVACRGVSHSKRAFCASYAFISFSARYRFFGVIMASFTEPPVSMAEVYCNATTIHAFPVDSVGTVHFAGVLSVAHVFQEAGFADQVFLLRRRFQIHFLLAVDEASKVWLCALRALEKASFGFSEGSQVVVVEIAWGSQAFVFIQTLFFDHFQCLCLDEASEGIELSYFKSDLRHMLNVNGRLAAWAAHEGECDPQSRPFVLEELLDAVNMENMPTG